MKIFNLFFNLLFELITLAAIAFLALVLVQKPDKDFQSNWLESRTKVWLNDVEPDVLKINKLSPEYRFFQFPMFKESITPPTRGGACCTVLGGNISSY